MGFKKSGIHVFMFFLFFVFTLSFTDARSEESQWRLMGKTKDKSFLVYYDTASVKYISKDYVRMRLKKELSKEGIEQFKKKFYASVKEAEGKAGEKVGGPMEPVLKVLLERETKEYNADIDCAMNELRIPPENISGFNFVVVDKIEPGTATENIRNAVCRKD